MTRRILLLPVTLLVASGWQGPAAAQTPVTDRAAARLLDQATWGPTAASISDVETMGMQGWLNNQFSLNVSDIPDQAILNSMGQSNNNLTPVQQAFFANAVNNSDQLRQRIAFILSQIWVVSTSSVTPAYAYPPYWRVFRDNAFGNYRDIIYNVTLNPAMGRYLNMANNNKGSATRSANENYGRELMQLFTVGLYQLNLDGSIVRDSHGNPVESYSEATVADMAKALTGWTYPTAPNATPANNNPTYYFGPMFPVAAEHDTTAKTVIGGVVLPAGQSALQDLNGAIDALMAQPTMAPFVCKQLIQHLVTSNPSPAYIQRVSSVFENNGNGVRGDMKAVITAILMDSEARAGDTGPNPANYGHLREPILWVANILRGLSGTVSATTNSASAVAAAMGESLFNEPSVFSYFSPNYALGYNFLAPEFQIYSTQTSPIRVNYVYSAAFNGNVASSTLNLTDFSRFITQLGNGTQISNMMNEIDKIFTHSSMSSILRQQATNAAAAATTTAHEVAAALYIVLSSGEYQVIQ